MYKVQKGTSPEFLRRDAVATGFTQRFALQLSRVRHIFQCDLRPGSPHMGLEPGSAA
jgi:hypothetical protein